MTLLQKIAIGTGIIFICLQFIQPARNTSGQVSDKHIQALYPMPENIKTILEKSCYDCHSKATKYPWYSKIQPGAWFLSKHIKEGKEELNFSEFGNYSMRRQKSKLRSMVNAIEKKSMPLKSYRIIHRDATLTEAEQAALLQWLDENIDGISH